MSSVFSPAKKRLADVCERHLEHRFKVGTGGGRDKKYMLLRRVRHVMANKSKPGDPPQVRVYEARGAYARLPLANSRDQVAYVRVVSPRTKYVIYHGRKHRSWRVRFHLV